MATCFRMAAESHLQRESDCSPQWTAPSRHPLMVLGMFMYFVKLPRMILTAPSQGQKAGCRIRPRFKHQLLNQRSLFRQLQPQTLSKSNSSLLELQPPKRQWMTHISLLGLRGQVNHDLQSTLLITMPRVPFLASIEHLIFPKTRLTCLSSSKRFLGV